MIDAIIYIAPRARETKKRLSASSTQYGVSLLRGEYRIQGGTDPSYQQPHPGMHCTRWKDELVQRHMTKRNILTAL